MSADFLYLLPFFVIALALVGLGIFAQKRRARANLGDMFADAVKDGRYRMIIILMAILFVFACALLFYIHGKL